MIGDFTFEQLLLVSGFAFFTQIVGGIARKHLGNIDALQAAVLRGDPFGRRCEKGMWA